MSPLEFTGSKHNVDPEIFVDELRKVFEVMHVVDAKCVELAAYQLKSIARKWFDRWKKNKVEGTSQLTWAMFEDTFLGSFFPRELRVAKMVANMRNIMSLFVSGISRLSSKEGKEAMLIGYMDMAILMVHVQHVEEDKLKNMDVL
ncbi:hypothetical protein MTR67_025966 [Solanum verrucosum]|uniref:Gag-pol polyprotein n=1 Tax=Solanum verrucosum TaxID=315347 RepID=A0AAF0QZN0_SOLVR|nr:hypothetical protein MTR67_025966 [Solanum verrucosum]